MTKVALITGVTGHDGSYLAGFLFDEGSEVHGIKRCSSNFNTERIDLCYFCPSEEGDPLGAPTEAKNTLGWKPQITFEELVAKCYIQDLKIAGRDLLIKNHGCRQIANR